MERVRAPAGRKRVRFQISDQTYGAVSASAATSWTAWPMNGFYWDPAAWPSATALYFEAYLKTNNASYTSSLRLAILNANGSTTAIDGSQLDSIIATDVPDAVKRSGNILANMPATAQWICLERITSNGSGQVQAGTTAIDIDLRD